MSSITIIRQAVVLLIVGAACRPAGTVRPVEVGPLPTAEAALEQLRKTGGKRRTLTAEGRVTYYGDQGRVRVRMEVVAERGDRFRVSTISPFEQPIDVMACDGQQLWLLSKGVLKRGPATPSNVARLLPLPLEPSAIVDTLMGGIPTGTGFVAKSVEASDRGWTLTVARPGSQETIVLAVDPDRQVVTQAVVERPAGKRYIIAEFSDFMDLPDGGYYPERIKMTIPDRDTDVRLKLKRPKINGPVDPSLFSITPPPGQPVRAL